MECLSKRAKLRRYILVRIGISATLLQALIPLLLLQVCNATYNMSFRKPVTRDD